MKVTIEVLEKFDNGLWKYMNEAYFHMLIDAYINGADMLVYASQLCDIIQDLKTREFGLQMNLISKREQDKIKTPLTPELLNKCGFQNMILSHGGDLYFQSSNCGRYVYYMYGDKRISPSIHFLEDFKIAFKILTNLEINEEIRL